MNIDKLILQEVLDYAIPFVSVMKHKKDTPTIKKPLTAVHVDPDSGVEARDKDEDLAEADSPTTRTRRFNRKNRKKVRTYLRKTQEDRVARNRDRRNAVKKHGKSKMANHDVHHPNGPQNGNARLVKKNHGPDKKNEHVDINDIFNMLYENLIQNIEFFDQKFGEKTLLVCGGAAGHMAHPYEDGSLTFADLKEMIHRSMVGSLDQEAPVTEKLDGQNLAFTVRDGRIVFARNTGHVKNRGQNALDVAGIRQKFAGRGNIEKAFTGAAADLEAAIATMPPEQRDAVFGNGSKFMNIEVIFPDSQNVIPYDKSILVFHGTISYDENGNEIGRSQDDAKAVHDALIRTGADRQKTFGIQGSHVISFSDTDTARYKKRMQMYARRLQRLQDDFDLDDDATIEDYKRAWWGREVDAMNWDLTDDEREGLIDRWATGSKAFRLTKIEDKELRKKVSEFEKEHVPSLQRRAAQPLERTFLQVGTDAILRVTDFLSANNPLLAAKLKKEVLDTIKELSNTDDQNKLSKLQLELERLDALGIDNIVPSEGVVFIYKGKPYKLTGTFAPVNQILGTLKFDKGKAEIVEPAEKPEKAVERKTQPGQRPSVVTQSASGQRRTVAIFSGRFQPFHSGHYSVYQSLVEKFGKDNVYIATSDVTDPVKSPFGFTEKQEIITTMFDVPADHVVQVANPYAPTEILEKLPPDTTYVTAVSQKDAERLGQRGGYFEEYEDGAESGYTEKGYFIIAPEFQLSVDGKNISGTQLRAVMGDPRITERAKKEIFTKVYGKFNPKIFKKVVKTTTEAEEAKELTTRYGNIGMKNKEKTKQMLQDKKARSVIRRTLRRRIKNPETGRNIFVATALGYEKTHPARKGAEELIRSAVTNAQQSRKKRGS